MQPDTWGRLSVPTATIPSTGGIHCHKVLSLTGSGYRKDN